MISEKCLLCGMDLMLASSQNTDKGRYYHLFSSGYNHENYKFIHLPVSALEDPSLTDGSEVLREGFCCIGGERLGLKIEPRASVAPIGHVAGICWCSSCAEQAMERINNGL